MIFIYTLIMPRGWGKTTALVMRSSVTQYPILCYNHATKQAILDRAFELGVLIPEPIVFIDAIKTQDNYRGLKVEKILIDDADMLLKRLAADLFHASVDAISMTPFDEARKIP